jgi:hypothetical protein
MPDWYALECGKEPAPEGLSPEAPKIPGDLYYGKVNSDPTPGAVRRVVSALLPTMTFTNRRELPRFIYAMDYDNAAVDLWAIDNTTREYGTINKAGTFTVVGTVTGLPMPTVITGLKFDPTSPNVYLSSSNGTTGQLHTLNLASGAATLVGPTTGFASLADIAIDNSGQMWSHDINGEQLVTVNKATGAVTPVGPTGLFANFAQGLDFDHSDGALYGFVVVHIPMTQGHVGTFNLTTGAFSIAASGPQHLEGAVRNRANPLAVAPLGLSITGGDLNGVLQPNETVTVTPRWDNTGASPLSLTGMLSNFGGPAGPTYTLLDSASSYGSIAPGDDAACTDCYSLQITSGTRPAIHWDTIALERVDPPGAPKLWTLHVGDSFDDVPPATNIYYRFIETIFHHRVTAGCLGSNYCPASSTTREQMAVFVLVAKEGEGFSPPACAAPNTFNDVPETSPYCRFIEELASRGVVAGCGGGNYCPTDSVTREQMAVFVLATLDPTLSPPACAPPNLFGDVPEASPFCRWIEELANRGVVTGCGGGNYCPADPVTREQMGVFLTVTFGLTLYGP